MDVKELLKSLIEVEPEIDEPEDDKVQLDEASDGDTGADDSQGTQGPEDTNADDVATLGQIAEALANRDKATNARIDSIEKKLAQLFNKSAATSSEETSDPEPRQTLAEMDFTTPAPKI